MKDKHNQSGIVLISTLMLVSLLLAMLGAYYALTKHEIANTKNSKSMTTGFYSAEAGLNLRAEEIRAIFVGYNQPSGTPPNSKNACKGTNQGQGDYKCKTYNINNREVITYLTEDPDNPLITTVPPGEKYQNLSTQEYSYTTTAISRNKGGDYETMLELQFKSRLIPLFQFAAFYDKDLEILPGANMNLAGPVYTNGDLYVFSDGGTLSIDGQTMAAGSIYRGRKNNRTCNNNQVKIKNMSGQSVALIPNCPSLHKITEKEAKPWGSMLQFGVEKVTVPSPDILDPKVGSTYFDRADLRLALQLNNDGSYHKIVVKNTDNSINESATSQLNNTRTCPGNLNNAAVKYSHFYDLREGGMMQILDVDMKGLLNCLYKTSWFGSGKSLSEDSDGGLVFHFTVTGPRSNYASSLYGVRLGNADALKPTNGGPTPLGLTVVTDQAAFTWGNYNSSNKIPASILADTIHILSSNWKDANCGDTANSCSNLSKRPAVSTTVNAAVLGGTDTTGNIEGTGGQGGTYSGGYENSLRFHEAWSGKTITYLGSIVSLSRPKHSNGPIVGEPHYSVPSRDWSYDTSFNAAASLPPLTPRFVYLRQELFKREFEQD